MTETWGRCVAIGASAGGLQPLRRLIGALPVDFPAPVVVGVHSMPDADLAGSLRMTRDGGPRIIEASDGEFLEPGTIYCIPAARHGLFSGGRLVISQEVKDSGFRPSIDAMFMTMATEYRDRAVAVILSGMLNDGMRGAQVIYDMGGMTLVQDPEEATSADMPRNVIRNDHPRRVLEAEELGEWLAGNIRTADG